MAPAKAATSDAPTTPANTPAAIASRLPASPFVIANTIPTMRRLQ